MPQCPGTTKAGGHGGQKPHQVRPVPDGARSFSVMYGLRLREVFGADRDDSEAEHLSAIRGLLLNWVKNADPMGVKYQRIQSVIAEVMRCLREMGYSNEPADLATGDFERIPTATSDLFQRYYLYVSNMWVVLAELRKL